MSNNTGTPGGDYRCYVSFRFFKVPQKVLIRKHWMILLVSKPVGSACADCSKILKMVLINTFETFRVEEIKELINLYIPEMTGLRNLSKEEKYYIIFK